jgi:hydroxymethylpyrimidine pyrophosphatase-like HAD family hydrolase
MDGTLLGEDGQISPRNHGALHAALDAGIEVVIATGRRHSFAMRVLRPLGLPSDLALISSNGTVTRTIGAIGTGNVEPIPSRLVSRTQLPLATALWLCDHIDEFRNALVFTFDRTGADGEDSRGALVVEHLDELNASIGRWMSLNERYIAQIAPIERSLADPTNCPIQAMLCGTIERMACAEHRLLEHPGVVASTLPTGRTGATMLQAPQQLTGTQSIAATSPRWPGIDNVEPTNDSHHNSVVIDKMEPILMLHLTEYPLRDLSILDILPANCSKGVALQALVATRGIEPAEILAIGDNWNDVSMLELAGRAVVMENAPDDLKAIARARDWQITASNRNDGVAEIIESILVSQKAI